MSAQARTMYFATDRCSTVTTPDGVPIVVSEVGPRSAPLTVVFAHGITANMTTWDCQRSRLSREWGDSVRMVFYDHRGHGMSGSCSPESSNVDQLGRDLNTVIQSVAPTGDVILMGHSMGGMAVMSYARQHPSEIGSRIKAVGLFATSAGNLNRSGIPLLLNGPLLPALRSMNRAAPSMAMAALWATIKMQSPIIRKVLIGTHMSSTIELVRYLERMFIANDLSSVLNFLNGLRLHDETDSLSVLGTVPTLVMYGEEDNLIPVRHSTYIADRIPSSRSRCLPGAGHMLIMERSLEVSEEIIDLVSQFRKGTEKPVLSMVRA